MTDRERVFILRQSAIDFFGGADRGHLESMRDVLDGMTHEDEAQAQAAIALIDAILLTGPE
jgi:hypothetical protein